MRCRLVGVTVPVGSSGRDVTVNDDCFDHFGIVKPPDSGFVSHGRSFGLSGSLSSPGDCAIGRSVVFHTLCLCDLVPRKGHPEIAYGSDYILSMIWLWQFCFFHCWIGCLGGMRDYDQMLYGHIGYDDPLLLYGHIGYDDQLRSHFGSTLTATEWRQPSCGSGPYSLPHSAPMRAPPYLLMLELLLPVLATALDFRQPWPGLDANAAFSDYVFAGGDECRLGDNLSNEQCGHKSCDFFAGFGCSGPGCSLSDDSGYLRGDTFGTDGLHAATQHSEDLMMHADQEYYRGSAVYGEFSMDWRR